MKTLVFGTLYIGDLKRSELTELWIHNQQALNPGCDYLLVDSNSDSLWTDFVPSLRNIERIVVGEKEVLPPLNPGLNWVSFPDNIGHLSHSGRDGWGRAFCRGIQYAIDHQYDYVVHIEADVLTRISAEYMTGLLQRHNLGAVGGIYGTRQLFEVGHMAMTVKYLKEIDFLKLYAWQNLAKDNVRQRPEDWIEKILLPNLLCMNWKGGRDEGLKLEKLIEENNLGHIDFITHAQTFSYYLKFLIINFPSISIVPIYEQNYLDER